MLWVCDRGTHPSFGREALVRDVTPGPDLKKSRSWRACGVGGGCVGGGCGRCGGRGEDDILGRGKTICQVP